MVTNMFHGASMPIKEHDRYLIYRLLNRKVSFVNTLKRPHGTVSGTVKCVRRNIFTNEIEIVIESRTYRFKEPQAIVLFKSHKGEEVVFIYGLNNKEPTDAALFREARSRHYKGDTIHDAMKKLTPSMKKQIRFQLGERVRRRFRSKDI